MHQSPELSPVALDVVSPGMSPASVRSNFAARERQRGRVALSMAHRHSGKHATPSPSRRINTTKPESPRSDVPRAFAVKQSQHRMCLGIAQTRFHFRVFQRAARTQMMPQQPLGTLMSIGRPHSGGAVASWFGSSVAERSSVILYGPEQPKVAGQDLCCVSKARRF